MYQLNEAAIHHLLVKGVPAEQGYLVGIQLLHRLCRRLAAYCLTNGINKHLKDHPVKDVIEQQILRHVHLGCYL